MVISVPENSLAASTAVCAAEAAQAGRGRPKAAHPPRAVPASTKSRLRIFILASLIGAPPRRALLSLPNRPSSAASLPRHAA